MRLATFIFILITGSTKAQDCKQYLYLQQDKTIETTIYNKKGDATGKKVDNVSNVKSASGSTTGTINTEMFDKKGKTIAKAVNEIKCTGGIILMDMKMMVPQQQMEQFKDTEVKAESNYLEYPVNLKEGDALKDGNFAMEAQNGPMKYTLNMTINERKVIGKESVTTTAGTWECFKISGKSKMHMKMGPIGVPMNFEFIEWYSPGFGIVKTENKSGGGTAITSIK